MTVVADSTPLISLSSIGRLDLLKSLYGRILIPPAVHREVVNQGQGRWGAAEVTAAEWIETRLVTQTERLEAFPPNLGMGEREAIILGQEVAADIVLMDELAGRRELFRRNRAFIGTIGVLQQAKLQHMIPALKPELDGLRQRGFHLSDRVYHACLTVVDE